MDSFDKYLKLKIAYTALLTDFKKVNKQLLSLKHKSEPINKLNKEIKKLNNKAKAYRDKVYRLKDHIKKLEKINNTKSIEIKELKYKLKHYKNQNNK